MNPLRPYIKLGGLYHEHYSGRGGFNINIGICDSRKVKDHLTVFCQLSCALSPRSAHREGVRKALQWRWCSGKVVANARVWLCLPGVKE